MKIEMCMPEEIERFKIDHPNEIDRILAGVLDKKALVTAYSENNGFVVTSLVAVDTSDKAIYLGLGPDAKVNQALVDSHKVSFNTAHDQVRVLFSTPGVEIVTLAGERVFKAQMPTEVLRFQRREFYRLPTSLMNPVKCLIDVGEVALETTVIDISLGGVGVLAYNDGQMLQEGDIYRNCELVIPDLGSFMVSLHVRALYEPTLRNGVSTRRAGCKFIDLAPSIETDIQRYIIRVERERRAHAL